MFKENQLLPYLFCSLAKSQKFDSAKKLVWNYLIFKEVIKNFDICKKWNTYISIYLKAPSKVLISVCLFIIEIEVIKVFGGTYHKAGGGEVGV